jgi:beta-lactamase regulating signal transducer with metallopeptidase domain
MIDPGFREFEETSVLRPRILGIKTPQDRQDRRNCVLLGFAIVVAIVIFGILEYKQLHDIAHEAKRSAMGMFKNQ